MHTKQEHIIDKVKANLQRSVAELIVLKNSLSCDNLENSTNKILVDLQIALLCGSLKSLNNIIV